MQRVYGVHEVQFTSAIFGMHFGQKFIYYGVRVRLGFTWKVHDSYGLSTAGLVFIRFVWWHSRNKEQRMSVI